MRDLINTGTLADTLTAPAYLVELSFAPTLYLSSGPELEVGGKTWVESGVRVDRIETDVLGRASSSLTLPNLDGQFGALVLNQSVNDVKARISIVYPSGSAGIVGPELLVDGILDGAQIGEDVRLAVRTRGAFYGATPRLVCAPPVFNHLPPNDTLINWGGNSYLLRRR